jgi:hypothetical protein
MKKKLHPAVVSAQPFQVADLRPVERLFEDDAAGRQRCVRMSNRSWPRHAGTLRGRVTRRRASLGMVGVHGITVLFD